MEEYSIDEGKELVSAARNTIELYLRDPHFKKEIIAKSLRPLNKNSGVFVTILHYPTGEIRGIGGSLSPMHDSRELVLDAAISAAFKQQKSLSITINELEHIVIQIHLISSLSEMKGGKAKRTKEFSIQRDGLLIQYGTKKGITLPYFNKDLKTKEGVFSDLCKKAGINRDLWTQPNVKIYKFETKVFGESWPGGDIIEITQNLPTQETKKKI